jgi:O-antigen/teichoic acid export membrane protein
MSAKERSFGHASIVSFAMIAATAIVTFLSQLYLANLLTPSDFGIFILSLSWLHILAMTGCLGFNTASLKFIPQLKTQSGDYLRYATNRSLCASLLLATIFFIVLTLLKPQLNPILYWGFAITACIIPIRSYILLRLATLRAKKYIALAQLPDGLMRPVLFVVGLFILSSFDTLNAVQVIGLNLGLHVFIAAIYFLLTRQHFKQDAVSTIEPHNHQREWLRTALTIMGMTSAFLIFQKADLIVFRFFMDAHDTGIYAAVTTISSLFYMAQNSLAIALNPMIAPLDAVKDKPALQQLFNQGRLYQALCFGSAFIVIALFGTNILGLYGAEYIEGKTALTILTGFFFISSIFGPSVMYATIRGQHRLSAIIVSIGAVITIVLLTLLIPAYGMIGAAISTGIGWFSIQGAVYFFGKKHR